VVVDLSQKSEVLQETLHNFGLMYTPAFVGMKSSELEKAAHNLATKCS
jgi:hypothetical protein